ncbi:hypothetical protein COCNU_scaffold007375G000010 [Cocos nucifera]|nr:hypothetical protein [Cocos nucifera]
MPPTSLSLHIGELISKPPIEREKGDDKKKKKKSTIIKIVRKARSDEPSDDGDDLGEDSFKNLETIQDLTDKFAMSESGHQILAHIKGAHHQEAEVLKAKEDLQAEIDHLKAEKATKAECLAWEKVAEVVSLQDALRKEEFSSTELQAMLALEEERRNEAKIKVIDLEARMVKLISEAMTRIVEEFKASSEMRNLNIAFKEDPNKEAGPSDAVIDPTPNEPASCLPKSTMEMPEPAQKLEAAKSVPTSSAAASSKGVPLKSMIRNLRKEVYHLKKKLKKTEDELQRSKKNALKVMIEVTCFRNLHMKDFINYNTKKGNFEKELARFRKDASDKSWVLAAKINSLETEPNAEKEKVKLLEGSSSLSSDRTQCDGDWSKKLSEL